TDRHHAGHGDCSRNNSRREDDGDLAHLALLSKTLSINPVQPGSRVPPPQALLGQSCAPHRKPAVLCGTPDPMLLCQNSAPVDRRLIPCVAYERADFEWVYVRIRAIRLAIASNYSGRSQKFFLVRHGIRPPTARSVRLAGLVRQDTHQSAPWQRQTEAREKRRGASAFPIREN